MYSDVEVDDLYVPIDQMMDKLNRQLIKQKEKTKDKKQHGGLLLFCLTGPGLAKRLDQPI